MTMHKDSRVKTPRTTSVRYRHMRATVIIKRVHTDERGMVLNEVKSCLPCLPDLVGMNVNEHVAMFNWQSSPRPVLLTISTCITNKRWLIQSRISNTHKTRNNF